MRVSPIVRTAAAGLGLALLLATGAQAQLREIGSSGGVDARAVVAEARAYRLMDRVDAALQHEGPTARVMSLAMAPGGDDSRELCGLAFLGERRYVLIHVSDMQNIAGSLHLTPVPATLNGIAVAHNDVYAQCGGVGRAHFIVEDHIVLD